MQIPVPGFGGIYQLTDNHPGFSCNYENLIVHSRTRNFEKHVPDSGLSIKLGVRGREDYFFGPERRSIDERHFLLVNRRQQFDCFLQSPDIIEAFCIYLSPALVADVHRNLTEPAGRRLDDPEKEYGAPHFFDRVYHYDEDGLGAFLKTLRDRLLNPVARGGLHLPGVYYALAEQLLRQHHRTNGGLDRLGAVRLSTREELYRRLSRARQYIFDHYTQEIDLDQLARVALLSKYHLLRSYKQLFGVTPYRDVIDRRLERARQLLPRHENVADVAYELGFSDRRAFAKAFRRAYGVPPSEFGR